MPGRTKRSLIETAFVPRLLPMPIAGVGLAAVAHDPAEVRERLDVVHDRGAIEEALVGGVGRARRHHPAKTLERAKERGLFAADVRAGALDDLDVEREGAAEDVLAEDARCARGLDGSPHRGRRLRVLAPDVDEAALRADRRSRRARGLR